MQTNYGSPDQHVEHVERIEDDHTSAGLYTQRLPLPAETGAVPVPYRGNRNNVVAIALIVLGVLMAAGRLLPDADAIVGGMIMLTIAAGFLFFSFWKHIYGLLIPGAILSGLGLGIPFADLTNGASILWGLALGFVAIMVVGRALFNMRSPWPMFPAVPLFCVGAIIMIASLPSLFSVGMLWFPLLLIGAGLYLGWGRRTA
jgi:hypothetical protein